MADADVVEQHMKEEDVADVDSGNGGIEQEGQEEASASNACEGLPGLAGDTPSGGQPVIAKLLISNAAAGSVIGKVGLPVEGHREYALPPQACLSLQS